MQPSAPQSILLVTPTTFARTESLAQALRQLNLTVAVAESPDMAARCAEYPTCVIALATTADARIAAALKPMAGRLIPLYLEPMALPAGHWATAPVTAQSNDHATAHALAATIAKLPAQPVPMGDHFVAPPAPKILLPSQRYSRRKVTSGGIFSFVLIMALLLTLHSCMGGK